MMPAMPLKTRPLTGLRDRLLNGPGRQIFLGLLFFSVLWLSFFIPPMQSPDELDHLQRAYLWGHGQFLLDTPEGTSSEGMVDTGLTQYMIHYAALVHHPDVKVTADKKAQADRVQWSHTHVFGALPGTGFYFPVIYTPQAVGLRVGEALGLSVDTSYRCARLLALLAIIALLWKAFALYPPNALAIALIVLPMQLFQMATTSIDGISMALGFLVISAFMRIAQQGIKASPRDFYWLVAASTVLISSRPHLLPLLLLPVAAVFYTPGRTFIVLVCGEILGVLGWLASAVLNTVDLRISGQAGLAKTLGFYTEHPGELFTVISATFSNVELLRFYWLSFIGILGWLNVALPSSAYSVLSAVLLVIVLMNMGGLKTAERFRLTLLFCAACSVALIFVALLLTWTPIASPVITGVQGRYFLIPALLAAYALAGTVKGFHSWRAYCNTALLILLGCYSVVSMTGVLQHRYYPS